MRRSTAATLDRLAASYAVKPTTSGMTFAIEQPSTGFRWAYGERRQHFVASITKLYTAAVVMQMRDEGRLTLDTPAADLLGEDQLRGLNTYGGRDHAAVITVRELLAHTSGILDDFEHERPDGSTRLGDMVRADAAFGYEAAIEAGRAMPNTFSPSTPGRAAYSDTNYRLLGRIIEVITGGSYADALARRVIEPLGLHDTWLFGPETIDRYDTFPPLLYGRTPIHAPLFLSTSGADGGLVSTERDGLRFLRAFVGGDLFPPEYLAEMTAAWHKVLQPAPLEYGIGVMRFAPPRLWAPFAPPLAMIGHSGATGTVLYHDPERDLYVSGAVNQLKVRRLVYQLTMRLAAQVR